MLQYARLPIEAVFFIEAGVVSVQVPLQAQGQAEGWMIGPEGLAGLPAVLGVQTSPHRRIVVVGGTALAMKPDHLGHAMEAIPELRQALLRYTHSVLVQTAQTGACNACHPIQGRLARTLLMISDRLDAPAVPMTHDALATLLGVRRASITNALTGLEQAGALHVHRGEIGLNRPKLEALTCCCYSVVKPAYSAGVSEATPTAADNTITVRTITEAGEHARS